MGVVYRAEDTRLGRTVAVKFVPDEYVSDQTAKDRFLREARTVSALNHPNVCILHDIGEDGGRPFLVMEYLEGRTLADRIAVGILGLDELLRLAIQAAEGMEAAHSRGVVHRDIKPANIFVTGRDQVKIMDFGLAKVSSGSGRHNAGLYDSQIATANLSDLITTPGQTMGTVAYMSPEQARGEELDTRTDLFSFGVVLYEMATGASPFRGTTTALTFVSILQDAPIPPPRVRPDLPAEFDRIVLKALEKDRRLRYQTASDLWADLSRLRRDSGSADAAVTRPQSAVMPAAKPPSGTRATASHPAAAPSSAEFVAQAIQRNKRGIALTTLAALVILIAAILYTSRTDKPLESLAVMPFVNVGGDPATEYLSDGIAESIINNLSQLPQLSVRSFSSVVNYKKRDVSPEEAGRELKVRAVLTGRLVHHGDEFSINTELIDVGGNRQVWGSQYTRKLADILAIQEQISHDISDNLRIQLSVAQKQRMARHTTTDSEAYQLYLQGRYQWNKRTLEGVQQSIADFQQAIQKDRDYALAYAGQADAYALLTELNVLPARTVMPKLKSAAAKALQLDDGVAEAHTSLAWARFHDWDWAGAEQEFKRAIALNDSYPTAHLWYGDYLIALGRFDEAQAEINRAHELNPLSPIVNLAAGYRLYYARQYPQATEQFEKTLAMDSTFVPAHVFLGRAYLESAMNAQAIAEFRQALELSGGDSTDLAAEGYAYAVSHQEGEARKVLDQLKERSQQTYVQPMWLAAIHAALGEKDQAFDWLQKAYEDRSDGLVYLKVDPFFDRLRSDPRFGDLARRIGLAR